MEYNTFNTSTRISNVLCGCIEIIHAPVSFYHNDYVVLEHFPISGPHGSWTEYTKQDIIEARYVPVNTGDQFGI